MHCFSSGIQDEILLLLDINLSFENYERSEKVQQQFPILLAIVKIFSLKCFFSDNALKS